MKWAHLLIFASLASCSAFKDDKERALEDPLVAAKKAAMDAYEPATGTWEGTFFVTSAPDRLMETLENDGTTEQGVRIRVTLSDENDPVVALKFPDNDWKPTVGLTSYSSNYVGWHIFIERSGGVWIEKYSITFDRMAEREAAITFARTVHNWYLTEEDKKSAADFYHMFGVGRVSKVDSLAATNL